MALFITQCPHCMTSFRTSITQLQSAEGMVRCGACLKIFVADDNLVPSADLRTVNLSLPAEEARQQLPLPQSSESDQFGDTFTDSIFTLDLADSLPNRRDPSISEQEPFWELLDIGIPEADPGQDHDDAAGTATGTAAGIPQEESVPPTSALESKPQEMSPSENSSRALFDENEVFSAFGAEEFHSREFEDALNATPRSQFTPENLAAARDISDPLELYWQPPARRGGYAVLTGFLALLLTTGLFAQYVAYNMDTLSQNSTARPWLEKTCALLGCELQPMMDIGAISSDELLVRSHTEIANALSVNVVFRNDAAFAQPFPALHLRFTDTGNQVVAERRFTPAEYLPPDLAGMAMMPAGSPVQVTLEILDPGSTAVNYDVNFSPMFSLPRL